MKLGICANFSHKSVGGSEAVIKHISERLVKNYNYEVNVYSFSCNAVFSENGVKYIPCRKGNAFISQMSYNDHIFVYSDSFWGFDTLVENVDKIDCTVSVCLVGAYHLQSHPETYNLLKNNINRFNLITHSSMTPDYKWCIDNNFPVKVIPNGVDLLEFKENDVDFRKKYNIKEKYIILNVSSYFYGKGFEILHRIAEKLSESIDDFVILQFSNVSQYPYDKIFFERTKKQSRGLPIKFIRDAHRGDIVAAFKASDIFLSCSKKEVAPLVILESRASKLPWVSMRVGDTSSQTGGIPVDFNSVDKKGYAVVDSKVINHFSVAIEHLLNMPRLRQAAITESQRDIEELDWDNIVPLYNEVFK